MENKSSTFQTINLYCDESCPIQNDGNDFLALAAVYCPKRHIDSIKRNIKNIKKKYGLKEIDELKWSKITINNVEMYKEIIDFIENDDRIRIRTILASNKKQNIKPYEIWYQSMYYYLFSQLIEWYSKKRHFTENNNTWKNFYNKYIMLIDRKDTHSNSDYAKTALYLEQKFKDKNITIKSYAVDSKEHQLIQIADIFAGAITYENRKVYTNTAKTAIVKKIKRSFATDLKDSTTLFSDSEKFNHFNWTARNF